MNKILVTGINGFIGRNIPAKLLQNHHIIGTGRQDNQRRSDLTEYIQCELGNDAFIPSILQHHNTIDTIIHCAASLTGNNEILKANCKGIIQIAELAKKSNTKKIIFLSSIPVIGRPLYIPVTEEHPLFPQTVYHSSKIFGENILNTLQKDNIQIIILRIPSPIGIGMDSSKIFSVFVSRCIKNLDINLTGEGKRIQNYIDAIDIWQAVSLCLAYNKNNIFNIAQDTSYSNLELAKLCIQETHSKSKICFTGQKDAEEDKKWIIDITKAQKELNFKPQISIQTSIKNLAQYYANTYCQ